MEMDLQLFSLKDSYEGFIITIQIDFNKKNNLKRDVV